MRKLRLTTALVTIGALLALAPLPGAATGANTSTRYLVVLAGSESAGGFDLAGTRAAALGAVALSGGTVTRDLSSQIGVLVAESSRMGFADALRSSALVAEVGQDITFEGLPAAVPTQTADPLEGLQWDMQQIRVPEAHDVETGSRHVDVGVLDSGVDGRHPDFVVGGSGSNVDCARGRDFVPLGGPGVGNPDPCTDNQFHGTHVAGTVAAQANSLGVVGVAPNVTLVPVKVCDTTGYCYASSVVNGITYAGDARLDVINMSFFVDDDEFQQSTEFKCSSDPAQRAFKKAVERAVAYARNQGVTPVAALGNSDQDLAHPDGFENECDVIPAETPGVIGVSALGSHSEKAGYSNYGTGMNDVSAPGGNGTTGDCATTILSTLPGGTHGCIQGTSMASPHAAGVAALIVSRYGTLGADGDVKLSPQKVESLLQGTTVDIGLDGYDECFGNGRIDALRAVTGETTRLFDAAAPFCAEYAE